MNEQELFRHNLILALGQLTLSMIEANTKLEKAAREQEERKKKDDEPRS